MKSPPTILIFSPSISGGLAEYTFYQASALEKLGARITCLITPSFLDGRPTGFETITCLKGEPPAKRSPRFIKRLDMAWRLVANNFTLAWQVWRRRPDLVLLDSYVEYLSPLWVWPHWMLARVCGVRYAANLHDPVRNYQVGPGWWHALSVRLAYWPLEFVLVHHKLPEPSPVPARVRVAQVPCGLFEIRGTATNRISIREDWGFRAGQKVFLAFGFVRDGKNLDLAIRALGQVPAAFLVVAGSVASAGDKPFAFYRELAKELGVDGRCRLFEGFVADDELGAYFGGTDFVLLTYASSFHSQSGVLNIAAWARKPVLASASAGPLIAAVENFNLGISVAPDSLADVVEGMRRMLLAPPQPRWQDYEATAAWDDNARGVLAVAGLAAESDADKPKSRNLE